MTDRELLLKGWRHTERARVELSIGAVVGLTMSHVEYIAKELSQAHIAIEQLKIELAKNNAIGG